MPLIAIDNVKKSYGSNQVLKGIRLDIDPGEVIAIIGKSGSGKATAAREPWRRSRCPQAATSSRASASSACSRPLPA